MSVPMSYYHKPRTNPLDNRTLFQILDFNTTQHPDKEAIVFYNENSNRSCLTFQQLKDQSIKFAASLLKLGFKKGDRVLLYAPNSLEFVICWIALIRIGACTLLKSPGNVKWEEFDLAKELKCKGLICGLNVTENQRNRLVSEITEFVEQSNSDAQSNVEAIITIDQGDTVIAHARVHKFDDLMVNGKNVEIAKVKAAQTMVDSEEPLFICFTSGSTGKLKAVSFTHHSIVNAFNLIIPSGTNGTGAKKPFLVRYMAWSSGAAFLASALLNAKTFLTCVYSKITMKDSFKYLFDVVEKERCTGCGIPPQHVHELIRQNFQENHNFSSIKTWSFGSQIINRKTIQSLLDVLPDKTSILVYAATEVLTVALQPLSHETITKKEDYGKMYMLPDIEVKVIDDQGLVVPLGNKGEICVRGSKVFLEYLEDLEGSAKAKDTNGWVHTSDYGIMFDRARIKVLGRKTELIDSHNQAVFPVEVEEILIENPDVLDVVAVGVPANDGKEYTCACVIEAPGSNLKEKVEELHKWCEQEYTVANSNHLRPKYIVFLEAFPITPSGKIDRRAITQLAKKLCR